MRTVSLDAFYGTSFRKICFQISMLSLGTFKTFLNFNFEFSVLLKASVMHDISHLPLWQFAFLLIALLECINFYSLHTWDAFGTHIYGVHTGTHFFTMSVRSLHFWNYCILQKCNNHDHLYATKQCLCSFYLLPLCVLL